MQRFREIQNLARYKELLSEERNKAAIAALHRMQSKSLRLVALYNAASKGVQLNDFWKGQIVGRTVKDSVNSSFRHHIDGSQSPFLILDPGPGLHIIDVNDAYAAATMVRNASVRGERMFDVFPDNPRDENADGVGNLYASLCTAASTGRQHKMAIQRYDVRDKDGRFVVRYWQPMNTPIHNEEGRLTYLLHNVVDVTKQVLKTVQPQT